MNVVRMAMQQRKDGFLSFTEQHVCSSASFPLHVCMVKNKGCSWFVCPEITTRESSYRRCSTIQPRLASENAETVLHVSDGNGGVWLSHSAFFHGGPSLCFAGHFTFPT